MRRGKNRLRRMNELEKMATGELYDFSKPEIMESFRRCRERLARFNAASPDEETEYRAALAGLMPASDPSATVIPPFRCDHGHTIRLGRKVFVNTNCTFLDSGGITVGDHTLIGPNCQLYTPQHPIDYLERRQTKESARPIVIGSDCWLGGGVIVCPGVRIGDRSIIAAGSVVVHDIPEDSLAAGNPAVVKRKLR